MIVMSLHVVFLYATAFPNLLGIILFITRTSSHVVRILCRLGLCVSQSTTQRLLRQLADDAGKQRGF